MLEAVWHVPITPVLAFAMTHTAFFGLAAVGTGLTLACIGLQKNIFTSLCLDLKHACNKSNKDKTATARVAHEIGFLKGSSLVMILCCVVNWFNFASLVIADDGKGGVPGLANYAGVLTIGLFAIVISLLVWHARHRYSSL